jgi:hypothetical protein
MESQPHIQAHLLAPTQWRPLRKQKSLNFPITKRRKFENGTIGLI